MNESIIAKTKNIKLIIKNIILNSLLVNGQKPKIRKITKNK